MNAMSTKLFADQALDRIEGTILPGLAITLEALLDAATLGPPAAGDAARSAELRTIAVQLNSMVRQLEAATKPDQTPVEWPLRISA